MQNVRELLSVCRDEMNGDITIEEALEKCNEIKYDKDDNADEEQ